MEAMQASERQRHRSYRTAAVSSQMMDKPEVGYILRELKGQGRADEVAGGISE